MGGHIAVIGIGTTVFAYQSRSGAANLGQFL
jgi:hypothetical protein